MTAAIPAICEEYPGCVRLNISEEEEEEEEGLFKADAVNEEDPECDRARRRKVYSKLTQ